MILVFASSAHGGHRLEGYSIPGYCDLRPPVRVPYSLYWINKKILIQAPYTKSRLEAMFQGEFPFIRFNYSDIRYLDHQQLVSLCQAFKITSPKIKSTIDRRLAVRKLLKEHG